MAGWITHMMIADAVMEQIPGLDRKGYSVGSIAPDCNVENSDWSEFMPPREITHWMSNERKSAADCEQYFSSCIGNRIFDTEEERSFFLGYYSHLVADACFQIFIRKEDRVRNMMNRILKYRDYSERMVGFEHDFDGVKRAFGKRERMRDVEAIEYEYLRSHPRSGYLTVLCGLNSFPDFVDYLPKGAIVRKIGIMAKPPQPVEGARFAFFTREEYQSYVDEACARIVQRLKNV